MERETVDVWNDNELKKVIILNGSSSKAWINIFIDEEQL